MANVASSKLETVSQRNDLEARKRPHFKSLIAKRLLGLVAKGAGERGIWIASLEVGRDASGGPVRRRGELGASCLVKNEADADGVNILSYDQARAAATKWAPEDMEQDAQGKWVLKSAEALAAAVRGAYTVADAVEAHRYFAGKRGQKLGENQKRNYDNLRWAALRLDRNGDARKGAAGLGDIAVNDLTKKILLEWRDAIIDPKNPSTRTTALRCWTNLHSCLEQAYQNEDNGITATPWRLLPKMDQGFQKRKLHFTDAQAVAIIDYARVLDAPVADYFEALYHTGARAGKEVFNATVEDYNPGIRRLTVNGKTGERHIDLGTKNIAAIALFSRLAAGRASTAPLLSADGVAAWDMKDKTQMARIKTVLLQATRAVLGASAPQDDKAIVPYAFRHTFVSRRLQAGMATSRVAEYCGTSEHMIKKTYSKVAPGELAHWIDATTPESALRLVPQVSAAA